MNIFTLPDLGEGLTEAEIVEWRVAVGDTVEVDQVVVEVETAKAIVDVPCPYAGRVAALHGAPGQRRPVGQPLVTIEPLAGEPTEHAAYREEERAGSAGGSGNVLVGYGTGHGGSGRRRRRVAPKADVRTAPGSAPRVISPLVRRMAREHGIDVATLHGSGPGGIVRRADIESALASAGTAPAADEVVTPLTGVRRAVAEKLSRSRREIPEVTIWVDVDATGLLDTRAAINGARPDRPVSLLALLARICVNGLQRYPELNSRVDTERGAIVRSGRINLGIAAQTERGLVVPVIPDAQRLTTYDLAAALAETTAQARAGTLPPARLTGGTFTVNNYGVFGVDGSTPIINYPEAALLGIGRIVDKPWVVDGQLAVRKVVQLSLTFDHRVCDGRTAGGFLRHIADCVEQPALLIANV
ncbi:dihydrolipoamide acetyltransferase family protein [Planosporangium flavigriseum]|uniref:Dihydrolipoamide acetyltransferase component of pyruvate dehydrogenase complex n=1 Tax=Planosporangium flavigriseum TaxID=373681 RepID=A0A8J3LNJ9_9ACTN|nr:dihydrolipoamide acetyltransferase component of pyruvate dehydrogenase complex [Planosporangium flavigriseum]